jgi:hypothetical protein
MSKCWIDAPWQLNCLRAASSIRVRFIIRSNRPSCHAFTKPAPQHKHDFMYSWVASVHHLKGMRHRANLLCIYVFELVLNAGEQQQPLWRGNAATTNGPAAAGCAHVLAPWRCGRWVDIPACFAGEHSLLVTDMQRRPQLQSAGDKPA